MKTNFYFSTLIYILNIFLFIFPIVFWISNSQAESTVVFNEVMYHPYGPVPELEWIEFYNQMAVDMDVSGWSLQGGVEFTFPKGTIVPRQGYLVVCSAPVALQNEMGVASLGPFNGSLSNSGELIELRDNNNRLMDSINYQDSSPWPAGVDGSGFTLSKYNQEKAGDYPDNWTVSEQLSGTPGTKNFPSQTTDVTDRVIIPIDANWRYHDQAPAPPVDWKNTTYDDQSWLEGKALFYAGSVTVNPNGQYPISNPNGAYRFPDNHSFEDGPLNEWPGYGPIEGWTHTSSQSGNNDTTGPFINGLAVPDGVRAAFIQNIGSLSQMITGLVPGQKYTVKYYEAERGYSQGNLARPSVQFANTTIVSEHDLVRRDRFNLIVSSPFTATTDSAELKFTNNAPFSVFGDNTFLFDQVSITSSVPMVTNGSFEVPDISGLVYNPPNTFWNNDGGGFVLSDNNSAFGNPPFEGTQAMVLQGAVRVWQTITGFEIGKKYVLNWAECDRPGLGGNDLQISIDSTVISSLHQVTTGWVRKTSIPFVATSTTHTLTFRSFNSAGGDRSLYVDEVHFSVPPNPPSRETLVNLGQETTYFRKTFFFDGNPLQATLLLDSVIDDGAVFYLNGAEVLRQNMPEGPVSHTTRAQTSVDNPPFSGSTVISSDSLVSGTNVLSVEVHQGPDTMTDLLFGTECRVIQTPIVAQLPPPPIIFNEYLGQSEGTFWVELYNRTNASVSLDGCRIEDSKDPSHVFVFGTENIPSGGYRLLSAAELGFVPGLDATLFLLKPGRTGLIDAVRLSPRTQALQRGESLVWLFPSIPTPGNPNQFNLSTSVVINEINYHPRPVFSQGTQIQNQNLVTFDSNWKYNQTDVQPDPTWISRGYDDSSWPSGAGLLYVETAALPGPKNTPLTLGALTYYFRCEFDFQGDPLTAQLNLSHIIDDGAVFYLNGQEIYRYNMPAAPELISHSTPASSGVGDAALVGGILIPSTALAVGTNVLAVEVHQIFLGSSDIVFGAELNVQSTIGGTPFAESTQGWIELFNKGAQPVDLTNWRFDKGITYNFPNGFIFPPGGYLVIAKEPAELQAEYPTIQVLGPYSGNLSRSGERIRLVDSFGNPADEVEYSDEGRWPEYADGDGHTLELKDPHADNNKPEAWAASNESQHAQWRNYSYRGVAQTVPGTNYPTKWNEFVFGLLTAGEFLIDDIYVTEDPNGTPRQLIQNSTFNTGLDKWRVIGNHHGSVVPDPDNPSNNVLKIRATGYTEHMHNHAETTYSGNTPITLGKEYEIRFRAKWLAGNSQLHTRLYFNHLANITLLEVPEHCGTPGGPNSVLAPNVGPTYDSLIHLPAVPPPYTPISVSVKASDPDGLGSMDLFWRLDGGSWNVVPMSNVSGNLYRAMLPGHAPASIIQFYVKGQDLFGNESYYPAAGPESRALLVIDDGRYKPTLRHNIRITMLADDVAFMHEVTNAQSNKRMLCSVVYDNREVFYNVPIRLKGSGFGRIGNRLGYNLSFDPDHLFRGVHDNLALDRNGGPSTVGASQHELLLKHIINRVGNLPPMYDDVADVIAPRSNDDNTAQMLMSRYNDMYLDSFIPNGSDGYLYEYELIYYPTHTVDENPESLKLTPNFFNQSDGFPVLGVDLQDMGNNKEDYRWTYLTKNHRNEDEFSRVMQLSKVFSLDDASFRAQIGNIIEMDEWMRFFAAESLGCVADTYNFALPHNIQFYVHPTTYKVWAMPWDIDHAFFYNYDMNIFGQGSNLWRIFGVPEYRRLFLGHMLDILNTTYNNSYADRWVNHYGLITGLNFASTLSTHITNRANFARNAINQDVPPVPFNITTNNGNGFTVEGNTVTLEGTGWVDIRRIQITGRPEALNLEWTSTTTWRAVIPLSPGVNPLVLVAYDFQGNTISSRSITINSNQTEDPLVKDLRITELMYNPLVNQDYEFVELHNTSTTNTLNLANVAFTNGITYTFPNGTTLSPGGYLVLAKTTNVASFRSFYGIGNEVFILTGYGGRFANEGERVTLQSFSGGNIICDFEYSGGRGWSPEADGAGHSLIPLASAMDNQPFGSLFYGRNWRSSTYQKGSPGRPDPDPIPGVLLNEVAANTDFSDPAYPGYDSNDWIELYNPTANSITLENCYLSDDSTLLTKYAIPTIIIPSGGRISFDEISGFHSPLTSGFGLSKDGEKVFLSHLPGNSSNRVMDSLAFKGMEIDTSVGRSPDGNAYWYNLTQSRDQSNNPVSENLYISEFMYHPPLRAGIVQDNTLDEYIEIKNPTDQPIPLWNAAGVWRLADGISYSFPPGVVVPANSSILVVNFNPTDIGRMETFKIVYPGLNVTQGIYGPYSGSLSNRGERVALESPMIPDLLTDPIPYVIQDEVIYFHQQPWTAGPSATGLSLHRSNHIISGNDPDNWMEGTPSPHDAPFVDPEATLTPTYTPTFTFTEVPTLTPTQTRTMTQTQTISPTLTVSPLPTSTQTSTPTITNTMTPLPTHTPTPTHTEAPSSINLWTLY